MLASVEEPRSLYEIDADDDLDLSQRDYNVFRWIHEREELTIMHLDWEKFESFEKSI
jgi:hypothetical protein